MSNVIKFPGGTPPTVERSEGKTVELPPPSAVFTPGKGAKTTRVGLTPVLLAIVKALWVTLALFWRPVKWLLSLDVAFQFFRMLWHWETPGVHAGLTFLLHFAVLAALTYFVTCFRPKGV
ncbi:KleE stable inheritance protein [Pandoraea apista]|uniref:KleE stable inheritance protein n=1 Tax=Pandoraea apista TaxID=93218 RepID=UPI00065789D8|nr:KleE stable inheritance protein [Pandoraea apista]ALS68399.1 hypothetical protein AT395_24970 [Pandoraea apista]CFB60420.1 hypothetical protein LMG16407_00459 [Pandoraea apista]